MVSDLGAALSGKDANSDCGGREDCLVLGGQEATGSGG